MMYMNTITGEVIDEERFDELVDEEMELCLDQCYFDEWLDENYSAHEIYSMCEIERQELYEKFYYVAREEAIENLDYEPIDEEE